MCIYHLPCRCLSMDLCVIDMSGPVQAGRYPSLGLLRLQPSSRRWSVAREEEDDTARGPWTRNDERSSNAKGPNLRDAILTSIHLCVFGGHTDATDEFLSFATDHLFFLKLWYFFQVFASYNVTDGKSFSPRTRDNCGGWPWGFLEGNLEI